MNARDELIDVIRNVPSAYPGFTRGSGHVADAVIAAGYSKPNTVCTARDLDALPEGTVVLVHGTAWQSSDGHWWTHANHNPYSSHELAVLAYGYTGEPGDIAVLHSPGVQS